MTSGTAGLVVVVAGPPAVRLGGRLGGRPDGPADGPADGTVDGTAPSRVVLRWAPTTIAAAGVLVAIGAAAAAVARPVDVLVGLAAVAAVLAMMARVEWAALAFVVVEPFEGYVKSVSSTGVKLVGALLFVAWLVRLVVRRSRSAPVSASLRHPAVYAAGLLVVALLVALTVHPNGAAGVSVTARYLSYVAALVVLVDCMRTTLPVRTVASVFVVACTVAAAIAVVDYLTGSGGGRAGGPVGDPNDFAFYLITAIPLALGLWAGARRWRWFWPVAAVVLTVATALTYSRGALLGLAAMAVFALLSGQVRARAAVLVAIVLVVLAALAWVAAPQAIEHSLTNKSDVAAQNVEDRYTTWTMAALMTADSPLVGLGPGGFGSDYPRYVPAGSVMTADFDVVHDMYLEVSAELGLAGLGAFLAMLGYGFAGAFRRFTGDRAGLAGLAGPVCSAFVGILVAAAFLSEQYYLPVWLLVAFGVALDAPRRTSRPLLPGESAGPAGRPATAAPPVRRLPPIPVALPPLPGRG